MGQQEIHEHEALGGGSGRRLYCRLTSFSRSLQIILRINLDGTLTFPDGYVYCAPLNIIVSGSCEASRHYCPMRNPATVSLDGYDPSACVWYCSSNPSLQRTGEQANYCLPYPLFKNAVMQCREPRPLRISEISTVSIFTPCLSNISCVRGFPCAIRM